LRLATEVYYRKVPASEVDSAKVRAAAEALALVESRLKFPPIKVVWCKEITEFEYRVADNFAAIDKAWQALRMVAAGRPDFSFKESDCFIDEDGGFRAKVHPAGSGKNVIYLNESEPEARIVFSVAHELQHLADWRAGLQAGLYADPGVRKRLESRADEFGRQIERELRGIEW